MSWSQAKLEPIWRHMNNELVMTCSVFCSVHPLSYNDTYVEAPTACPITTSCIYVRCRKQMVRLMRDQQIPMKQHVHNKVLLFWCMRLALDRICSDKERELPLPQNYCTHRGNKSGSCQLKTSRHRGAQVTPVMPASTESEFALKHFHFVLLTHGVLHRSPMHRTVNK